MFSFHYTTKYKNNNSEFQNNEPRSPLRKSDPKTTSRSRAEHHTIFLSVRKETYIFIFIVFWLLNYILFKDKFSLKFFLNLYVQSGSGSDRSLKTKSGSDLILKTGYGSEVVLKAGSGSGLILKTGPGSHLIRKTGSESECALIWKTGTGSN